MYFIFVYSLTGFKALYDNFRHAAGDRCLISFANFIKEFLGENGIFHYKEVLYMNIQVNDDQLLTILKVLYEEVISTKILKN